MTTHASAGYQAAYGTVKGSNLLTCTVQSAPCDPQQSQGCHSGVAPYPHSIKVFLRLTGFALMVTGGCG
jgi:hypothetical protein